VNVTLLLPSVLRGESGGAARLDLTLGPEARLTDLFDTVAKTHPRLERRIRDEQRNIRRYVNVYVDGEEARRLDNGQTRLRDGAEVHVIPSVAGG
jgi:molybdopterin converting factor small subunit